MKSISAILSIKITPKNIRFWELGTICGFLPAASAKDLITMAIAQAAIDVAIPYNGNDSAARSFIY